MRLNRNGRVKHERESRRPVGSLCTLLLNRGLYRLRAHCNFRVVNFRTRNREHQSRCVAEVLYEGDWTGATRQIMNAVESQLDIVKLFARLFEVLVELYVDDCQARARDRF